MSRNMMEQLREKVHPKRWPVFALGRDLALDRPVSVAVDIGDFSVKIAKIQVSTQGPVLVAAGVKALPPPSGGNDAKADGDGVGQVLTALARDLKIKESRVKLVISDPGLYVRQITIPRVGEDELQKAVRWQAEKFAPFSIDDAVVDYQPLDLSAAAGSNQMEIVIVAAANKMIDRYLQILRVAQLTPAMIDISPFAVARAAQKCCGLEPGEIVPVIDIGEQTSSVVVVRGDALLHARRFEVAGRHLTGAIAKARSLDPGQAQEHKRTLSLSANWDSLPEAKFEMKALQETLSDLVVQIDRSLAYCEKEHLTQGMTRLLLCGGGAHLAGLDQYLSARLGLAVQYADPLKNMKRGSPSLQENGNLSGHSGELMAVVGELV